MDNRNIYSHFTTPGHIGTSQVNHSVVLVYEMPSMDVNS